MQNESRGYDEIEINLHQYVGTLMKHKKTFFVIFFLIVFSGFFYLQFSPRIYRISMLIQPPVSGEESSGANDLESAENLRGLIISQAFNEELIKRLNLKLSTNDLKFSVFVPPKTNVLEVSINLETNKKEFGIVLLRGLSEVIFDRYAKRVDANNLEILNQVKQNERSIASAKEKIKNLQDQIREISLREKRLGEEINAVNANTAETLKRREELLKDETTSNNMAILLLTNFLQNNMTSLNQMNNQLSDLSFRRANANMEIRNFELQINDFQTNIDKLSKDKNFISNVRIVCQPGASTYPISPDKKKILALSIFMGLFFGVAAVFVQEFWQNEAEAKARK